MRRLCAGTLAHRVAVDDAASTGVPRPYTKDRSSMGGKGAAQFPFRSTLQLKPGVRIDMGQYPILDTRNYYPNKAGGLSRRSTPPTLNLLLLLPHGG